MCTFSVCFCSFRASGECHLQYFHQQLWVDHRNHYGKESFWIRNVVPKMYSEKVSEHFYVHLIKTSVSEGALTVMVCEISVFAACKVPQFRIRKKFLWSLSSSLLIALLLKPFSHLCFLEHDSATFRDPRVTDMLIMNCLLCN